MTAITNIGWTEMTWNPTTGCTKVSSGCKNCYAERWALMHQRRGIKQYQEGFDLTLAPQRLSEPLRHSTPKIIFVNSMSDLFHEAVPDDYLADVFKVMNAATQHQFQILTKRPERFISIENKVNISDNIWLGVSVEDSNTLERIDSLRSSSIKNIFVSFEPLIGSVESANLKNIKWVIAGGESGPRTRPVNKQWVNEIMLKCDALGIPFFFKQWGKTKHNPDKQDPTIAPNHPLHAMGGCQLDGKVVHNSPFLRS